MSDSRKKKAYRTSFRSEIQATDSTNIGWMPKNNAVSNEAVVFFEIPFMKKKTSIVFKR